MINSIQYLRAFAALAVVIFHANNSANDYFHYTSSISWLLSKGYYGVDVFFVISGFIISYMVIGKEQNRRSFIINRISRIAPPYWFATIAVMIFYYASLHLFRSMRISGIDILSSFTFTSWIQNKHPILHVGWTLGYEIIFYILIGFTFNKFKKISFIGLISAIITINFLNLFNLHNDNGLNYLFFLQFTSGIILFLNYTRKIPLFQTILLLVTILICELAWNDDRILIGNLLGLLTLSPLLFLESHFVYKFNNPIFLKIGDASYSIYLMQALTIPASAKLFSLLSINHKGPAYLAISTFINVLAGIIFCDLFEKNLFIFSKKILARIIVRK